MFKHIIEGPERKENMKLFEENLKADELIQQLNISWKELNRELQIRQDLKLSHKLSVLNMKEAVYDLLTCSGIKPNNKQVWLMSQKYLLFHNKDMKLKEKLLSNVKNTPIRDRFFMMDLAECVRNWAIPDIQIDDFKELEYDEKFVKNLSLDFFDSFKDQTISDYARIYTTEYNAGNAVSHLKEHKNVYYKFYPDYFRGHSFYLIQKTNTLLDYFFTNHQIMECITLGMHPKEPWNHHVGLTSATANMMDYLFIDYLRNRFACDPLQLEEIEKLIIWKNNQVTEKADAFLEYQERIEEELSSDDFSFERIYENICALNRAFTSILSEVLGYAMYEKWKKDPQKGLEVLKRYIRTDFPLEDEPDFTFLGLSDERLIEYALQFRNYGWKPEFMRKK